MKAYKTPIISILFLLVLCCFNKSVVLADEPIVADTNQIEIITSQAWYDMDSSIDGSYLPTGINNDAELVAACAEYLTTKFSNVTYTHKYIRNELGLGDKTFEFEDFFNSLGPNQIVIWQGHGTWDGENNHSVLWTGRYYDESKLTTNADYQDGSIVNAEGNEAITSKYISKHAPSLDNSLIYLGQCDSGHDAELALAFLAKGAAAVIVNTKIISAPYGDMMQYTTIKSLGDGKTLKTALNEAKTIYGQNDSENFGGLGAEPIIYGNENYSISTINYKLNLIYNGLEQTPFVSSDGYVLSDVTSAINPGEYTAKATLNTGYIWSDGTTVDKEIKWSISKKQTSINDFIHPTIPDLTYDENSHKLLSLSNPNSDLYFALQDEDENVGTYSNEIPELTNAGNYYVNWYCVGNNENTEYGSERNPIIYPVEIKQAEYKNEKVIMSDYLYEETPSTPKMTNNLDTDTNNTITYYYDTKDSNLGGKEWKNITPTSLSVGTYYIYGIVLRDNYKDYISPTTMFHVYNEWPITPNTNDKTAEYIFPKTGIN